MRTLELPDADYELLLRRAAASGLTPGRLTAELLRSSTDASGLIVKTPGVCGGSARVVGSRIAVWLLERLRRNMGETPRSPEWLHDLYPHLTLDGIVAALAYARENPDEIEAEIRENDED